jgi:hypothetical protein
MPTEPSSAVRAQLEDLADRCNASDLRDQEQFDGHRRLIASALHSTNGAVDKISAIAETQGQLAAFIVQQSIREPHRLALAFKEAHSCPLETDEITGKIINSPWERMLNEHVIEEAKKEMLQFNQSEKDKREAGHELPNTVEFTIPFTKSKIVSTGKSATIITGMLALAVICVFGIVGVLYLKDKVVQKGVASAVTTAIMELKEKGEL